MNRMGTHSQEKSSDAVRFERARRISRFLMIVVLMAAFILLALAVSYYTSNTAKAMEAQLCKKMEVSVEQTRRNVDYRLEQVEESTRTLISIFYPYLNSDADFNEQLSEYNIICNAMAEQLNRHMIASLRLYVPDKKIYSGQQTNRYALRRLSELESQNPAYGKGGVFWEETHAVKLGFDAPREVLSCVVALKSQKDYEQLSGVLFSDVYLSQFQEIFAAGSMDGDEMFLTDKNGCILVHQDMARIGTEAVPPSVMQTIRNQGFGHLADGDSILVFGKLEVSDWYIISSMPRVRGYMMNQGTVITIMTMWIVTCLILFILAVTVAYNLNLSRTVRSINAAVQTLEAEGMAIEQETALPTEAQPRPLDEFSGKRGTFFGLNFPWNSYKITSLEQDTEQIVRSIASVVEARYQDRLAISEYQMEALQEQIKPHFLYNTLDVIKWMILDQKSQDSVWMVNALSKYLRMSISKGKPVVPLSEELELTRMYLGIMQKRFANQFQVEYELEEETLSCHIPRLSLQPLVENALMHGVLHCDKKERRLTIRAWRSGDSFTVEIEDNGNGMPEEQARLLTEAKIRVGKSYGVANVRRRLHIFGQGKCNFLIVSREGVGTCVTIELPIRDVS